MPLLPFQSLTAMLRSVVLGSAALSLVLGLGLPSGAEGQPSSPSPPDTLQDTVNLAQDGTVEITDTHTGRITVSTWNRERVAYEVAPIAGDEDSVRVSNVRVNHSEQRFTLDHEGGSWSINIPGLLRISPGGENAMENRYRVTMPKTAALEIDDFASTIEVTDVQADVQIDSHQGDVSVDSVDGLLEVETHEGTIDATALRGGIRVDTHEGTASVSFDQFSEASSAEMHAGRLRFFLPADAGFTLETDFASAELTIDEAFGPPATKDKRQLFNGGGPTLSLNAFSGTIELRPLAARKAASAP